MFLIQILRKVAKRFKLYEVGEHVALSLELSETDKSSMSIMTHVGFLKFFGCDLDTIQVTLALYR